MTGTICFLFLGGLPDPSIDPGMCWKEWMHGTDPKDRSKLVFAVHPIKKTDEVKGYWTDYLQIMHSSKTKRDTDKFPCVYLNENDNHLKTAWATRSLADATILMIKESYAMFPSIEKFILLEGKSCPLYPLKTIYKTITKDRKSWLDPMSNKCRGILDSHPFLYCEKQHCLKKKDCSVWSQWCILDTQHISSLLKTNLEVIQEPITCGTGTIQQIQVSESQPHPEDAMVVKQSLIEMLDADQKPCTIADELFFGLFLKRFRSKEDFISIIQTRDEFKQVKYITDPQSHDKSSIVKSIRHSKKEYIDDSYLRKITIRQPSNYNFYLPYIRFDDMRITDLFSVASIYTDWRNFNLNPHNVFRSLVIPNNKYDVKKLLNSKSIHQTIKRIQSIPTPSSTNRFTFENLNMSQLAYWAHPLEYNTIPSHVFVNGYNLMVFLHNYKQEEEWRLEYLLELYQKHVLPSLSGIKYKKVGCCKYIVSVNDSSKLVGTPVDASILNDARSRGCLFIRKCEPGSNIHLYSKQLYSEHPDYIYE